MNIGTATVRGRRMWVVDSGVAPGGRKRWFFATEAEAEACRKRKLKELALGGIEWASMPDHERQDAIAVVREIRSAGLTARAVWNGYRSRQNVGTCEKVTMVRNAVCEFIDSRAKLNRRDAYIRVAGLYLRQFIRGREELPVSGFTHETVEEWFSTRKEPPVTRVANSGKLSAFFSFCVRRGYIVSNPMLRVERVAVERKPPSILSVEQAEAVMVAAQSNPRHLAWVTLALFAGIRPQELNGIGWGCVSSDFRVVTVDAAASKVRRRRIVELESGVSAWLELSKRTGAQLPAGFTMRRGFIRGHLLRQLNWKAWKSDVFRHSAASYLLARHKDAQKVSLMLGNSPTVLFNHYRELVSSKEADAFWGITPQPTPS